MSSRTKMKSWMDADDIYTDFLVQKIFVKFHTFIKIIAAKIVYVNISCHSMYEWFLKKYLPGDQDPLLPLKVLQIQP